MKRNNYNTSMPPINNRTYGRHIQHLVHAIKQEKEREKRTAMAYTAVKIIADYTHAKEKRIEQHEELWKELYSIAQEDLQIDAPYPYQPIMAGQKKMRVPYPKKKPKTDSHTVYLKPCVEELTRTANTEDQIPKLATLVMVAHRLGIPVESADQLLITLQPLLKRPITIPHETIQQIILQNKPQHVRKTYTTHNRNKNYRKKVKKIQKPLPK